VAKKIACGAGRIFLLTINSHETVQPLTSEKFISQITQKNIYIYIYIYIYI